jgi:pyrimidine-nucleoside phosphorylase
MLLGAGRDRVDQGVDPAVGIVCHKKLGDLVMEQEPILTLHVNERRSLDAAMALLRGAVKLGPSAGPPPPLIRAVLS